jgi:hypothetical protein
MPRKAAQNLESFPPDESKLSSFWKVSRRTKASFPVSGKFPAGRKQTFQFLKSFPPDEGRLSSF